MATLTVYPDANPETTTVDGYALRGGVNETFTTIRGGAGTQAGDSDTSVIVPGLTATSTTNQYSTLRRAFILFDTSSLTSAAIISGAVLSVYGGGLKTTGLGTPDLHVGSSTPASNTALVSADYSQRGTTSFGSISNASFSTSAYNDITLNASGIAAINKTGVSKFSLQLSWDINNSFTGSWASSAESEFSIVMSDTGSNKPKLVITYTLPTTMTGVGSLTGVGTLTL
jgi:hypothetical protein